MQLSEFLHSQSMSRREAATWLGISPSRVNQLCKGETPSLKLALLIQKKTHNKVPLESWDTSEVQNG